MSVSAERRLAPLSEFWGSDRGLAIDRHYIERFLERAAVDVRGRVLEVDDSIYSRRYGGDRVDSVDVLDLSPANPRATVVDDLTAPTSLESGAYDCLIVTQTLQCIVEVEAAVATLARLLRPGGVLLASVPVVGPVIAEGSREEWRFDRDSFRHLLETAFAPERVEVAAWGNPVAAAAFLYGLAAEELDPTELDATDERRPLLLTARAVGGERS